MTDERHAQGERDVADNVSPLPADGPSRQLRRVGTKIGRKVLPFQRLIFRWGPIHVYRNADGGFGLQWIRRRP